MLHQWEGCATLDKFIPFSEPHLETGIQWFPTDRSVRCGNSVVVELRKVSTGSPKRCVCRPHAQRFTAKVSLSPHAAPNPVLSPLQAAWEGE